MDAQSGQRLQTISFWRLGLASVRRIRCGAGGSSRLVDDLVPHRDRFVGTLCHAILESGVNTVVYSAEAASEPSYSKFRVNGNLDRVYKNIKRFHKIREKHYSNSRVITRVSGVKVPHTEKLEDMEKFWGDYVDQVAFVKYNPWENTYEQPINGIETPCSDLWRRMFIWWDGSVNPCDSDYKSTLNVGNGFNEGLSDLWCSQKYKELRSAHLAKQRNRCSPCNRCVVV